MSKQLARIEEKEIPLASLMAELRELMDMRDEALLPPDEAVALNNQIKAYVEANLRKVDNVRAFWRYAEDMIAAAERDLKDAGARHRSWESKLEFLKTLCLDIMIGFGEKKLEGQHGYIRLQVNGGSQSIDIYSPALIPEDLVQYSGWMSAACMALIPAEIMARQDFQFTREPKQGTIKAILETECSNCDGEAKFKSPDGSGFLPCVECAGTGHKLVPGARLSPRGQHARIR